MAGRRARGAKDFEPVSLGDGGESCHVRVALGRRRQDAFEGGLADFSLESLELHRREADQRPCSACLGVEGVRHPLGAERERASCQREGCVGNPEGQLTLEDVEPLVLLGVDVPRRPHAGGHDDPRALRASTDEVMFELRALSGQEYVDRYAKRKDVADVTDQAKIGTLPAERPRAVPQPA